MPALMKLTICGRKAECKQGNVAKMTTEKAKYQDSDNEMLGGGCSGQG